MTPIATVTLVLSLTVIWGGLIASIIFLARKPEVDEYPADPPPTAELSDEGGEDLAPTVPVADLS